MTNMRILFLTHRLPFPPDKGERIRAFYELKYLAERHEVDLYCFADSAEDARQQEPCLKLCREVYVEVLGKNSRRLHAAWAATRQQPMSSGFFYSATFARKVEDAVRDNAYDLIFVNCSSMGQYLSWPSPAPVVVDFVDADSSKWEQYARSCRPPKSWLFLREARSVARFEKFLLRRATLSLAVTEHDAAELCKGMTGIDPVEIISNGVEVPHESPSSVNESIRALQPFAVFVGTMSYRPNADAAEYFAREIFPEVRRQHPDLNFVIVGRDPAPRLRRLEDVPGVKVAGSVPDVYPYFRCADVSVAPFRISQGFHNKIAESLAVGTPVVTSSRAAKGVGLSESAGLFTADDPKQFAAMLHSLLVNGELRRRLRETAPAVRTSLSWESRLQPLEHLIAGLVDKQITVHSGMAAAK
jgi:sugar transferase (PEP-CTERM/EpsH1 system associated)